MKGPLTSEVQTQIMATASRVWAVITDPDKIKEFLFGAKVFTDWKPGSPIRYEGEYEGKSYVDKGIILRSEPPSLLESTYWSAMSGKEDKPENYNKVTYHLSGNNGRTVLRLMQDNIGSPEELERMRINWNSVLQKIKEIAEQEPR